MIRRINTEPRPKLSSESVDIVPTLAQTIDEKYDRLNHAAVIRTIREGTSIFELDRETEANDQLRAINKNRQKRQQRLAKRAMRRESGLPPTHSRP